MPLPATHEVRLFDYLHNLINIIPFNENDRMTIQDWSRQCPSGIIIWEIEIVKIVGR